MTEDEGEERELLALPVATNNAMRYIRILLLVQILILIFKYEPY